MPGSRAALGVALGTWLPLVLAVVGGVIGWRLSRTRRRWRSMFDEVPAGMSREAYKRRRAMWARVRRYWVTFLSAALGAGAGYLLLAAR